MPSPLSGRPEVPIRKWGAAMHQWLLWSRFAALNLVGLAGLVVAAANGWVAAVIRADSSRISILIFGLFLFGLCAAGWRVAKITRELDHIESGIGGRQSQYRHARVVGANASRALELRLFSRIAYIRHVANVLVLLGLVGTVVGFVMALSGIDAAAAGDVDRVGGMIGTLIEGMGVALYTTLVGAVLNLWLGANYQLLATGTATLAATLIDLGEANRQARPDPESASSPVPTAQAADTAMAAPHV